MCVCQLVAARVCVSVVCAPYWTESGRGDGRRDGQGDVEKDDHQSYMRPHMIGKTRGKEEDHFASFTLYRKRSRNNFVTDKHNAYYRAPCCPNSRGPSCPTCSL